MARPIEPYDEERDKLWQAILKAYEESGITQSKLAELVGQPLRTTQRRLARAKALRRWHLKGTDSEIGHIELWQSSNQLGPWPDPKTCEHPRRLVLPGVPGICLECGKGGLDHMRDMKGYPLPRDKKPEKRKQRLTRKQRRDLAKTKE